MTDTKELPVIAPFRGIRYNPEKVSAIQNVITPPYDVITPEKQAAYYEKDPYNMIRLDLNREPGDEKYAAARRALLEWLEKGVLTREAKPALYLHSHTFEVNGETITRKGFIALRRLEDFSEHSAIKPHENTLDAPKEDRFKLSKACSAYLSQIFGLYSDPEHRVEAFFEAVRESEPLYDFTAEDGSKQQFWISRDPIIALEINRLLEKTPIFIADGHHRYETALRFSRYLQEGRNGDVAPDETLFYTPMYLSNMDDKGLVVLPIHRAVRGLSGFAMSDFLERLKEYFVVECMSGFGFEELNRRLHGYLMDYHAYLFGFAGQKDLYIVRRKRREEGDVELFAGLDPALAGLDVTVLHRLVFERILGMSAESQARQEYLDYYKDDRSACEAWEAGAAQVLVFMNPTGVQDVQKVASQGLKMPQKSTFFYPKLPTGLVMAPIVPGERVFSN